MHKVCLPQSFHPLWSFPVGLAAMRVEGRLEVKATLANFTLERLVSLL